MAYDSDNETDWGAITRNVLLLVLVIAGIGVWKWMQSGKKPSDPAHASSVSVSEFAASSSKRLSAAGAPPARSSMARLVIGEKAVTADEARSHVQKWLEKNFQIDGLTPEPALLRKDRWQPFARAIMWEESGDPRRVSNLELQSLARDLAPVAKEHPVSAYLVGMTLMRDPGSEELLQRAFRSFSETPGSETLAFHAAAGLAMAASSADEAKSRADAAIAALRKALDAEEGYSKHHDRVIAYVLMSGHLESFFSSLHEQISAEVSKTSAAKPWVKKWIEGQHCLQKGWDARGGGYSNTVSDDGQSIFRHESEKARRLLQEAWNLKPEDPSPAVNLIYSSLSLGRNGGPVPHMRQWFDAVLQLQVDAPEAAQHFLWGLRKRWYGSHAQMCDLGLACADTGRFDSSLPWVLLQAHRDCASEWDVPDAYFKEMSSGNYAALRTVFEGAEAESKRAPWRSVDRTQAAIFEFKCGHYEEAQKWLEKLESKPNRAVLEAWPDVDIDLLVGKTAAFAKGDTAEKLRQAESAEQSFQSATALALYRETLAAAKDKVSEAGRKYLESRAAITEIEKNISEGSGASLIPDADFRTWTRQGGGWKIDQKTLTHWGPGKASMSTCQARIGSSFTAEGEIEVTEPGDACHVWLAYGYPERGDKDRWIALRFAYNNGKVYALLSNGMGQPLEQPEIKVESRFRFKFVANPTGVTLLVNDAPAFQNVPVPDDYVREQWGQIGVGAATKSDTTRVKIHSLTVKR
jgi:tetratricopeptide (TPR) repeat protein